MRRVVLGSLFVFVVASVSARGETVHVDNSPGCSDINGAPYCTINKAILAAAPNDTIQIAAGTYGGTIASFSKPLTFIGAGPDSTIIAKSVTYAGTGPLAMASLRIQGGGSNLKISGTGDFSGLTVSDAEFIGNGNGAHGIFIKQHGRVSNVAVTSSVFNGHGQSGFLIQRGTASDTSVDGVTFTGSTFDGNGEYGLRIDPRVTGLRVESSAITNNAIDGLLLLNADGVVLEALTVTGNRNGILLIPLTGTDSIANVSLTNVTASNNTKLTSGQLGSGLSLEGGAGTISTIHATGSDFSGNSVHGVVAQGSVSDVAVECSTIESNGADGIHNASAPPYAISGKFVYWGCSTGPGTEGCSAISGDVEYEPYRAATDDACGDAILTGIAITPAAALFEPGQSGQFIARASYSDGSSVDVSASATWTSSVAAVASVSSTGVVTAIAEGATAITADFQAFSSFAHVTVEDHPTPLPPDPASVAPPIDPTKITTVHESTRFLYEGATPLQTGVAPATIERVRAAVIRGRVLQRGGVPLARVTITILGRPEYGQTTSRADGGFDLAVNGGGELTVQYRRNGFIDADRTATPEWNDWFVLEDVVMVPYDPAVTTIDLAAPGVQVHRATTSVDKDGTRTATLLFAPGTTATMTLPDGTTQALPTLSVRATEYTVGDDGPQAMPATLPPQSAYTYCVELSADEAVAANASQVDFSQPVTLYVEDFLSFGAGADIPMGHYSQDIACWIAGENGRAVTIMAIVEGRAYLDIDGDGNQDDSDAELGTTIAEREKLATLYSTGATLWRASIPHFTPFDLNLWNWFLLAGEDPSLCTPPLCEFFSWEEEIGTTDVDDGPAPKLKTKNEKSTPQSCTYKGSIVECESQILGEEIEIAGVGTLSYRTSRVPGRTTDRSVTIPLSTSVLPNALRRIDLVISGAGKDTKLSFDPQPDLSYRFTWDGKDAYGRTLQGRTSVYAQVRYIYAGVYTVTRTAARGIQLSPSLFGRRPSILLDVDRSIVRTTRFEVERTQGLSIPKKLGTWDARGAGLGGWTLSDHHVYDHSGRALQYGTGTRLDVESTVPIVRLVAGDGTSVSSGDGQSAREAGLAGPITTAVGPDGSIYIGESGRIRRVDPKTKRITTFAGNGSPLYNGANHGSPLAASFSPTDIAVTGDGSMLIADETNARLYRIRNGVFSVVAGNGSSGAVTEGGTAISQPVTPHGVAAVGDCIAYIADRYANKIWRVMCDGKVYTVAGNGEYIDPLSEDVPTGGYSGEVPLSRPAYVAVASDGQVYFTGEGDGLNRIDPNGFFSWLGHPIGIETQPDPYSDPTITPAQPGGIAVVGNTIFHARPTRNQVERLILGIGTTPLSSDFPGYSGDDGPVGSAQFFAPADVAFSLGRVYVADTNNDRVRVIEGLLPPTLDGNLKMPSPDGSEFYEFDGDGKQLKTVSALTGLASATFEYDADGLLQSVTDVDGNVTELERAGNGVATAIVAAGGQRTTLEHDGNGFLSEIRNPAGEAYRFTYTGGGLLRTMRDPRNQLYEFDYDGEGRLIQDRDPAQGSTTLARQGDVDDYSVTRTSAEGRAATHYVTEQDDGARTTTVVEIDGTESTSTTSASGQSFGSTPHGSGSFTQMADSRFGFFAPLRSSSFTSGRSMSTSATRTVVLSDPADPFSTPLSISASLTVNGRLFSSFFDAATRTTTKTSPAGRTVTETIDAKGRIIRSEVAGVLPLEYAYDGRGLLDSVTQGVRVTTFGYDAKMRLTSITDPLQRTIAFDYDDADRVIRQTLPDQREIVFEYDDAGNLIGLTPPGRAQHQFEMTPVNLQQQYEPPSVSNGGPTAYTYDRDRELTRIALPGGATIDMSYNNQGQLESMTTGRGEQTFGYHGTTGDLIATTTPEGQSLSYTYDGILPVSTTFGGEVSGSVSRDFNAHFSVSSETACGDSGCSAAAMAYDDDQLLIGAGALSLTRRADNGQLTAATLLSISDAWTYSPFGEPATYESRFGSNVLFREELTRDDGGRITQRRETIGGVVTQCEYDYDSAGRLTDVTKDGVLVSHYEYDTNGNRVSKTTPSGVELASCDGQDRMTSYAGTSYTYTPDGTLESATNGSDVTNYVYDDLGNLLQVRLSDGRIIDYVIDGQNRRIGRKVDGTTTHRWLYGDQLRIVAELDANGAITSRFVYGTRTNVPEYMVRGGVTYRFVTDHLGSPRLVVNAATGAIAQRMDYDEFGRVLNDTTPGFKPFGFAGGLFDGGTALTRFGARDYDPLTGRWTAKDPIGFDGGDPNLFAYCANDPINRIDSEGTADNSVNAQMRQAIARGDADEIANLLDTAGDVLDPKLRQAAQTLLRRLRTSADDLISQECKGSIRKEFPSEYLTKTLEQILKDAKKGVDGAKKAKKLLTDKRFKK
jgi:RHS repeat-associated protein